MSVAQIETIGSARSTATLGTARPGKVNGARAASERTAQRSSAVGAAGGRVAPPIDRNRIATFVKVAETGSFTAAAAALGLPKSSVSRSVAGLEADLGVLLL